MVENRYSTPTVIEAQARLRASDFYQDETNEWLKRLANFNEAPLKILLRDARPLDLDKDRLIIATAITLRKGLGLTELDEIALLKNPYDMFRFSTELFTKMNIRYEGPRLVPSDEEVLDHLDELWDMVVMMVSPRVPLFELYHTAYLLLSTYKKTSAGTTLNSLSGLAPAGYADAAEQGLPVPRYVGFDQQSPVPKVQTRGTLLSDMRQDLEVAVSEETTRWLNEQLREIREKEAIMIRRLRGELPGVRNDQEVVARLPYRAEDMLRSHRYFRALANPYHPSVSQKDRFAASGWRDNPIERQSWMDEVIQWQARLAKAKMNVGDSVWEILSIDEAEWSRLPESMQQERKKKLAKRARTMFHIDSAGALFKPDSDLVVPHLNLKELEERFMAAVAALPDVKPSINVDMGKPLYRAEETAPSPADPEKEFIAMFEKLLSKQKFSTFILYLKKIEQKYGTMHAVKLNHMAESEANIQFSELVAVVHTLQTENWQYEVSSLKKLRELIHKIPEVFVPQVGSFLLERYEDPALPYKDRQNMSVATQALFWELHEIRKTQRRKPRDLHDYMSFIDADAAVFFAETALFSFFRVESYKLILKTLQ
jgi:hypothetical protein